jgi:hypothetical protein
MQRMRYRKLNSTVLDVIPAGIESRCDEIPTFSIAWLNEKRVKHHSRYLTLFQYSKIQMDSWF